MTKIENREAVFLVVIWYAMPVPISRMIYFSEHVDIFKYIAFLYTLSLQVIHLWMYRDGLKKICGNERINNCVNRCTWELLNSAWISGSSCCFGGFLDSLLSKLYRLLQLFDMALWFCLERHFSSLHLRFSIWKREFVWEIFWAYVKIQNPEIKLLWIMAPTLFLSQLLSQIIVLPASPPPGLLTPVLINLRLPLPTCDLKAGNNGP